MEVALKAGYRHIDCAHIYGNEAEIGETLQKCFREGVVKREKVFVTSKLWYVKDSLVFVCILVRVRVISGVCSVGGKVCLLSVKYQIVRVTFTNSIGLLSSNIGIHYTL